MPLRITSYPPAPSTPQSLPLPRLMQSISNGAVYLVAGFDTIHGEADACCLYHAPMSPNSMPFPSSPELPVGTCGAVPLASLKDYANVLSLQNEY